MKKIISAFAFLSIGLGIFLISSCSKEKKIIPYSLADQEICIPVNPFNTYYVDSFTVFSAGVKAIVSSASISQARLKEGYKVEASASGATLDELTGVEVYYKIKGTGGAGKQIAYSSSIPSGATSFNLNVNGEELKDALTNDITIIVKILNKAAGNNAICVKLKSGVIEFQTN